MKPSIVLATVAILLAPLAAWAPADDLPEPNSLALWLIGAVAAGVVTWRKRRGQGK